MARYGITFTIVHQCYTEVEAKDSVEAQNKVLEGKVKQINVTPLCDYIEIIETNEV